MIIKKQIDRILRIIVDYYTPDQVYLFGSQAKGVANHFSDIDLLVIKETPLPRGQRGKEVKGLLANHFTKIDFLFLTPAEVVLELSKENSFLSSIHKNAIKIYEKK